jgi:hypothetical protein
VPATQPNTAPAPKARPSSTSPPTIEAMITPTWLPLLDGGAGGGATGAAPAGTVAYTGCCGCGAVAYTGCCGSGGAGGSGIVGAS